MTCKSLPAGALTKALLASVLWIYVTMPPAGAAPQSPQGSRGSDAARQQDSGAPTTQAEGYLVHESERTGEQILYRYRVMSDTTVRVRQGQGSDALVVTLPRLVALTLSERIAETFPVDSAGRSNLQVGYEDRFLRIGFLQRVDLLVLGALALATLGFSGAALVLWRRLRRERRRRAALTRARQHQAEGQERERRRLAREIHDGPVQDLHGLHMHLAAAGEGENGAASAALMQVAKELRAVSADLHPPALEKLGLAAALRSFAGRFEKRHPHVRIELHLEGDGEELSERTRLALFRVAQEAMNNAARHAAGLPESEGCYLIVRLRQEDGAVHLDVRDDGSGFDVPKGFDTLAANGHLGLLGMTERVESIGGTLSVCSAPGEGTQVSAQIPRS